jgi:2-haloacid dehalogenase
MQLPKFITFDCYGTLVDFTLTKATLKMLGARTEQISDMDAFLAEFSKLRFSEVLGEYQSYRQVLCRSLEKAMTQFGLDYQDADGDAIVAAVPEFGPFPEVPGVLRQLKEHCKLAIITNSDDDLIAGNVAKIGVPFDYVITAEQARAYKPTHPAFHYLLKTLGCSVDEILHVAQGFNYDIIPASELGWRRVWINRNSRAGDQKYGPYNEMPDMKGLPEFLGI